jgi:hypothetical protein
VLRNDRSSVFGIGVQVASERLFKCFRNTQLVYGGRRGSEGNDGVVVFGWGFRFLDPNARVRGQESAGGRSVSVFPFSDPCTTSPRPFAP